MLIERGNQHTLAGEVSVTGRGLHTGEKVEVVIKPCPPESGICFLRRDLGETSLFRVGPEKVVDTQRATTIGSGDARISTVEHLLAAVWVLKLDNLRIEVKGPEIPIMDGSAEPFYRLLHKAGKKEQNSPRIYRNIERPYFIQKGRASLVALPADRFRVTYTFVAPPPIGNQVLDRETNWEELLSARTFGWKEEVEELRSKGLIKGGDEDCALLFSKDGECPEFRIPDEPVSHKVADLLGDLALYRPLFGHIIAFKAGHSLHNLLVRELLQEEGK